MNDDFFELPDKEFSLNNDKEKQNRENALDLFFKILDKEKIQYDLAPYTKRKFINNQIGLLGDYKLYISVDPNTDMKKICSYLNKELIKFGCHVSRDEYNTLILSYDKSLLVKEQEIRNYDTIVFDIGGVLIEREEIDLRDLRKLGIYDEVELRQLMIIYYDIANENDTATYKEVLEKYEKALPDRFKPKAKELIELSMHKRVCKYTVPLLKELKSKGYKLYYLSNASKHRHEVSKKKGLLNFLEYFDGGLISYKEGVEKPNPEFYNRLLKKYKLKASDCLFIDDNSSNIEMAQNLGFKTLYYNNPKSIDLYSIIESASMVNETLELPEDNNTLEEILNNTSPNKIYFTSDWHLFKNHYKHEANYVNTRNIIAWCRQNIKDNDIFFYLGDISFRWANEEDQEESMKIMASLPGIKVLILGNHDKMLGQDYFANCGFKYVFEEYTWKNYIFTHKPINMDMHSENMLNIHGHIHNITKYNTTDGKRNVNVYPMYYDNKPVTLSYITSHVEELTKDHEWNWNVGYGESALLETKRSALPEGSAFFEELSTNNKPIPQNIIDLNIQLNNMEFIELDYTIPPNQFLKQNGGTCWDYVCFEDQWFDKYTNIEHECYYIESKVPNSLPTHTILIFKYNNIYYYFESSFKSITGIYYANNINNLISFCLDMFDKYWPYTKRYEMIKSPHVAYKYKANDPKMYNLNWRLFIDNIYKYGQEVNFKYNPNYKVNKYNYQIVESKRSELPDSSFGIPEDRKYPLDTEQHVKSAIKLFGHAEESKKKSLAKRINVAAKKYGITIPETTQCYKYLSEEVINSCYELSNCIELPSDSNITSEWAMASCNPIKGISKPFILKITPDNNSTINPKLYAFSPDIISDKYLVVNENAELEIVNSDRFNNCFIESYEFIGENQDYLLGKIYKAYKRHKIVDNTFFYTTLTGKPMLCEDQIDYDSLFRKVDLDLIVENINTELATLNDNMMKCIYNISTTLPVLESVANKVSFTKRYDGISIKEDINGYYFDNEYTNKRSRSEKNIHSLTEAMLKSTL